MFCYILRLRYFAVGVFTTLPHQQNLLGLLKYEIESLLLSLNEPLFRAQQVYEAIYRHGLSNFANITTISKKLRSTLDEHFLIDYPKIDQVQQASDGVRKYRFVAMDGQAFESVYIPEVVKVGRVTNTLCISSQTGCSLECKFCFTASLKHYRNLSVAEIIGQVFAVSHDLAANCTTKKPIENTRVTNVVFMGMGEPLLNYDNVLAAVKLLIDADGMNFSNRRVTVSTAGIVPRIYDLGRAVQTQFAISLNATTDEVRSQIMPINKKWPLNELIAALRAYPLSPRRRLTVEYVMLGGVNDSLADAHRLINLLSFIPVKINLLPLNAHPRTSLHPPSMEQVLKFQKVLRDASMNTIIRSARGQDIAAACGQLGENDPK
ncbi:MAG: 23S rRNA (adenine(2503)-C(2))-methyltransferase RlmN [Deltaproteobacteria bacterium]|nr:23S rRNA (adenine(2503)-C(2))-methyltransferase RlmN [Deltaproteobacteria bacterium]